MGYVYLASPYSDPNPLVRRRRHLEAEAAVCWMLTNKLWVYSPIVHCHFLAEGYQLPLGADFWIPYNRALLERASALCVLEIEGTAESKGVREEVLIAGEVGLPVKHLKADGFGGYRYD